MCKAKSVSHKSVIPQQFMTSKWYMYHNCMTSEAFSVQHNCDYDN